MVPMSNLWSLWVQVDAGTEPLPVLIHAILDWMEALQAELAKELGRLDLLAAQVRNLKGVKNG